MFGYSKEKDAKYTLYNNASMWGWIILGAWILGSLFFLFNLTEFQQLTGNLLTSISIVILWFLCGSYAAFVIFRRPLVRLIISPDEILIKEIYIYRLKTHKLNPKSVNVSSVVESKDSESDPYFELYIESEQKRFKIAEGHFKDILVATQSEVLTRIKSLN